MSDFMDAVIELLPEHNSLKNSQNQLRKVLDTSVGEWFDNMDINSFYDDLFIDTATGSFLDLFGRDYGVIRQSGEPDTAYRERIIQEKNDKLTPSYLKTLYSLKLYTYISTFNIQNNTMVSDNVYIQGAKMAEYSESITPIVASKFIIDNNLYWISPSGFIDYIIDIYGENVLYKYHNIYDDTNPSSFEYNQEIADVKLHLENAVSVDGMFSYCSVSNVELYLPFVTDIRLLFAYNMRWGTSLTKLILYVPNVEQYSNFIADSSPGLEYVDLTVPDGLKETMISKFSNTTNYPDITTLIVNGEEVDLS